MKVRKVMSSTGMEGGYWAQRDGYYVGMNGDPKSRNPSPSGTPNYDRWNDSWDRGHEVHLRMKTRSEQDGRLTEQVFGDLGRIANLEQQLEKAEKKANRLSNYETAYNNLRLLTRSQYDDIDTLTDDRNDARAELDVAQETVVALSSVAQERDEALADIDGMREEGCAAVGVLENIFNGVTAVGVNHSDPTIAKIASVASAALVFVPLCEHKEELAKESARFTTTLQEYADRIVELSDNNGILRTGWADEKEITNTATRAMEETERKLAMCSETLRDADEVKDAAQAELTALSALVYSFLDFTPNCGDDNKCFTCGEQWYPNKCEISCLHAMLFKATREANDASMVWLELCDERDDAVGVLKAIRSLCEDMSKPMGRRHVLDLLPDKADGE